MLKSFPKIVTIVGARPQFIKAAALSRQLRNVGIDEILVHTGQHFDDNMADIFFRQMDIPEPQYNLGINSVSHGAMTGRMLEGIEKVLLEEKPSSVVVFGDTDSTLAGALAARKLGIPVAHVEAGLRSYNMSMPEEINRVLTDRISDFLFCPTDTAVENLQREGFGSFNVKIENTGDVMYDVALRYSRISPEYSGIVSKIAGEGRPFILATLHRRENTGNLSRLKSIIASLNRLSEDYRIVFPIHPGTRKILEKERIALDFSSVDPVGYFDIIELLKYCAFVITDSGGLQKEAFFFRKQCLVMRKETEWTELVDLGYNFLVDVNPELVMQKAAELKDSKKDFHEKPYGEGNAAEKIAKVLLEI
jgi:UDP-GlcNAc3NAcA epimerase